MYIEGMKESRLPSLFSVPFSLQRKFRWGFSRAGGILFGFQLFWSQKHFYRGGCRYWSEKCTGIWDFYELLPVLYECTYFHIPVHLYAPLILSQSHPACLVSLLFEMEEGPWRGWGWGTIANESLTLNQHLGFS